MIKQIDVCTFSKKKRIVGTEKNALLDLTYHGRYYNLQVWQ